MDHRHALLTFVGWVTIAGSACGASDGGGAHDDATSSSGSEASSASSSEAPSEAATTAQADSGGSSTADSMGDTTAYAVVYLDFDGGVFAAGPEDARSDQPGTLTESGPFEAVPPEFDRATVVDAVRTALAAFDLRVTDVRPTDGDYNMVVFTPTGGAGGVVSIAYPDCNDARANNVGIVYAGGFGQLEPAFAASAALAVIGQSFGLEQTMGDDAMSHVLTGSLKFANVCVALFERAPYCPHTLCEEGQQNSHAELLATIGAAK